MKIQAIQPAVKSPLAQFLRALELQGIDRAIIDTTIDAINKGASDEFSIGIDPWTVKTILDKAEEFGILDQGELLTNHGYQATADTPYAKALKVFLEKKVKNTKTGNTVKIGSLPEELKQKYIATFKQRYETPVKITKQHPMYKFIGKEGTIPHGQAIDLFSTLLKMKKSTGSFKELVVALATRGRTDLAYMVYSNLVRSQNAF